MELEKKEQMEESFDIGFDANPPRIMVVRIPIAKYAEDKENGTALCYGKMREAQAIASNVMKNLRSRSMKAGVIGPDGKPMVIN